jgi:hypothetical protein
VSPIEVMCPHGASDGSVSTRGLDAMFIGHFAVGFAAKRFAPRTSLGWLIGAALFLDLLWPVLVPAGIESVRIDPGNTAFTPLDFVYYPWSHSALMTLV